MKSAARIKENETISAYHKKVRNKLLLNKVANVTFVIILIVFSVNSIIYDSKDGRSYSSSSEHEIKEQSLKQFSDQLIEVPHNTTQNTLFPERFNEDWIRTSNKENNTETIKMYYID